MRSRLTSAFAEKTQRLYIYAIGGTADLRGCGEDPLAEETLELDYG
ncbi:hypothetical protein [Kitasatospora sp. NPDC088134]